MLNCTESEQLFSVPDYPNELYYVEVPVISNDECSDDYGEDEITENMLCAGDKVSVDSCQVIFSNNHLRSDFSESLVLLLWNLGDVFSGHS